MSQWPHTSTGTAVPVTATEGEDMPVPAACPDRQALHAYALGHLREEEVAALRQHVERCSACLEVVQAESTRDPVTRAPAALPGRGAAAARPGAGAEVLQWLMPPST